MPPSCPSPSGDTFAAANGGFLGHNEARRRKGHILAQIKDAVSHPAYQVVISVRLNVPRSSPGEQFTKYSVTPPLLLHWRFPNFFVDCKGKWAGTTWEPARLVVQGQTPTFFCVRNMTISPGSRLLKRFRLEMESPHPRAEIQRGRHLSDHIQRAHGLAGAHLRLVAAPEPLGDSVLLELQLLFFHLTSLFP